MTVRIIRWKAAWVAGLTCLPAIGWAQPPDGTAAAPPELADDVGDVDGPWNDGVSRAAGEEARALFREGNRLYRLPNPPRAIEKYKAAIARWPHPRFYFNLAIAQSYNDDDKGARDSLEQALQYGKGPLGEEMYARGLRLRVEYEAKLGRVRVTCNTRGATVTVDNADAHVCTRRGDSWLVWAKPGRRRMIAAKDGFVPVTRDVQVAQGAIADAPPFVLKTPSQEADASRRFAVWVPWSVIGAGLALTAAGAGFHARAAANYNDHDARFEALPCITDPNPESPGCPAGDIPPDLADTLARADQQQASAVGLYVAAGAVLATGLVLVILNRPRDLGGASDREPTVALQPVVSSHAVGVSAVVHFGGM